MTNTNQTKHQHWLRRWLTARVGHYRAELAIFKSQTQVEDAAFPSCWGCVFTQPGSCRKPGLTVGDLTCASGQRDRTWRLDTDRGSPT